MSRAKLIVEEKAEQHVAEIARLRRSLRNPGSNSWLHLEKSGDSVLFNLGEGIVSYKPRVKINKYEIARAEAKEVQSALKALGELTAEDITLAHDLADSVIAMLTNMIKNLENRI